MHPRNWEARFTASTAIDYPPLRLLLARPWWFFHLVLLKERATLPLQTRCSTSSSRPCITKQRWLLRKSTHQWYGRNLKQCEQCDLLLYKTHFVSTISFFFDDDKHKYLKTIVVYLINELTSYYNKKHFLYRNHPFWHSSSFLMSYPIQHHHC